MGVYCKDDKYGIVGNHRTCRHRKPELEDVLKNFQFQGINKLEVVFANTGKLRTDMGWEI